MTRIATHYATPDDNRTACGQRVQADGWGKEATKVSDDMDLVNCKRCLASYRAWCRTNP